jgi:hypothetical protein
VFKINLVKEHAFPRGKVVDIIDPVRCECYGFLGCSGCGENIPSVASFDAVDRSSIVGEGGRGCGGYEGEDAGTDKGEFLV